MKTSNSSSALVCDHGTTQLRGRALASRGGEKRTFEGGYGMIKQSIKHFVIVRRVVMKRNDPLWPNPSRKFERVPIGAVTPSNAALVLLVCVLSVVNE